MNLESSNVAAAGDCPRCQMPLTVDQTESQNLRCSRCGGMFVPPEKPGVDFLAGISDAAASGDGQARQATALRCPACHGAMQAITIDEAELERCFDCGGSWIDGEQLPQTAAEAGDLSLGRTLLYCLTLPERTVRSGVGLAAGTVRETAEFLLPQAFQSSKTYEVVVRNSLRFLTEDVGGVKSEEDAAQKAGEDFLARKAVGNFVDMAGLATLHVSPLWLLAIVSDVAYGTKSYVQELAAELKKQGLIDENATITRVDDVLEAVRSSTGHAAGLFDAPPLSVDELKQTLEQTRTAILSADYRRMIPESEISTYWNEIREIAERENVSMIGVSGALTMHTLQKVSTVSRGALCGVQVVGGLFSRHIIGHYANALKTIQERGFYETLCESSAPYIEAVWSNFAADRETWTEQLLSGKMFGRAYDLVTGWLERRKPTTPGASAGPC